MGRRVASQKFVSTKAIVNAISTTGWTADTTLSFSENAKVVASGALTSGVLSTVLSITGPGQCPLLAMTTADTTSRTMRMQVICDGITVFDSTSAAIALSAKGGMVAGSCYSTGRAAEGTPIRWNSSFLVKVASSLTETDKINIAYRYELA